MKGHQFSLYPQLSLIQPVMLEKAENAFDDSSRYEGADDLPHWHHGEAN